jgi:DNA-binding MarR family transcriptional regulator
MARLDAHRISAWRGLQARVGEVERAIDAALREEWDIPLNWFDVLAALQRLGGKARPSEVAEEMGMPLSSLTRRFDRLEEDGWVTRRRVTLKGDHRAVLVELTRRGRNLWRAMNVTYRRAVQSEFAQHLDGASVDVVHYVIDALAPSREELPVVDDFGFD